MMHGQTQIKFTISCMLSLFVQPTLNVLKCMFGALEVWLDDNSQCYCLMQLVRNV